jgi:hypothetical protein
MVLMKMREIVEAYLGIQIKNEVILRPWCKDDVKMVDEDS